MKIIDCKVNHVSEPLGFDLGIPRVSWKVAEAAGKKQKAARILVSKDKDMSDIVFDSGYGDFSSLGTPLDFKLEPYTHYFWTVEIISDENEKAVSGIHWFETAKLDQPWVAKWLTCDVETQNPVFETEFYVSEDMADSRLYICGLGLYVAFLNGERIGKEYLAPGCHDYAMWQQYQTYSVNVRKGWNTLSVSLGNGWYKGRFGMRGNSNMYGDHFLLIAEVRRDGNLLCKTDENWKVYKGNIGLNGIYDGEHHMQPEENRIYDSVLKGDYGTEKLKARLSLPVVVKMELQPVLLLRTPAGETVLDIGQNMAGFIRFRVMEPKGKKVRLLFGEILQNGNFYNGNLRTARAEFVYESDGQEHIVEPFFTYYGFRYVKVEGITNVKLEDFTGCVLYSDLQETGKIVTDNEKINRLFQNTLWGQRGNYVDIPTDCPQRDERLGWTGDTQVFSGTACFHMDSYAFLNKYLVDVDMTQRQLGYMPSIIPAFDNNEAAGCAWGDVSTIVPWNLYQYYGDKAILAQQFRSMKFWADYIYSLDDGSRLWKTSSGFGDWLALDHDNPKERFSGGTELTYLHTAYYYYSTWIVSMTAEILEKESERQKYGQRAREIKNAFQQEYFTATGRLAVTTQTAYVVALYMGLVPEASVEKTVEALKEKLKNSGGYLKTGFIGTPLLCPVLSEYGNSDLAYQLVFN